MSTPTAAELIAGLGAPTHQQECSEVIGHRSGAVLVCPWISGLYYEAREAEAARIDHLVIRHDNRRPKGVDSLHEGVVEEWREAIRKLGP